MCQIECEIVQERPKAVLIQQFHSSGSNPDTSARTKWVPRSCITASDGHGVTLKKWFVAKENLWAWTR